MPLGGLAAARQLGVRTNLVLRPLRRIGPKASLRTAPLISTIIRMPRFACADSHMISVQLASNPSVHFAPNSANSIFRGMPEPTDIRHVGSVMRRLKKQRLREVAQAKNGR